MPGIYLAANISIPDFIPFGNTGNARALRFFPWSQRDGAEQRRLGNMPEHGVLKPVEPWPQPAPCPCKVLP